jgi:hypothetical protein
MAVTGKSVICEGLTALRHPPLVSVDAEHDGRGPGTKDSVHDKAASSMTVYTRNSRISL